MATRHTTHDEEAVIQPIEHNSTRSSWLGLIGWLAVTAVAATIGSIASVNAREFYAQLSTPTWAPPGWLFGPVWTTLYFLMAIAAWLVWRDRRWTGARGALTLFLVQLAVNAAWSWVFFDSRRGQLALVVVIVLGILIVLTMIAFARVRRSAALLLLPYLLWVCFATALTAATWQRNPGLL